MALANLSHLIEEETGPRCVTHAAPDRVASGMGETGAGAISRLSQFHSIWFPDHGQLHSWGYIAEMLWRVRNSRDKPKNAPAAFIQP